MSHALRIALLRALDLLDHGSGVFVLDGTFLRARVRHGDVGPDRVFSIEGLLSSD
jgi:hypothetical protein